VVHWAPYYGKTQAKVVFVDIVLVVSVALIWWSCVRRLSRANIHVIWQRCVILVLALPVAIVGGIATFVLLARIITPFGQQNCMDRLWFLLAEIPVVGVIYGFGRLTRAIVASAAKE
jgi:hypothetical protein